MVRQLLDDLAQRKGPGERSSECQPPSSEMSHNGTVTYSDDFREQCFLLQLLKIKFIVRQGLERSISKIKRFFFFIFLSKQEREMACWRAWNEHIENHLSVDLGVLLKLSL